MKLTGIIAEFNPLHSGHKILLEKAHSDSDGIVVLMSGDFVQRGEPAIYSKYERAEMALRCGADAVLELPPLFSTGSAEYFSEGSVRILDALGVNTLLFGSECGDVEVLKAEAEILLNEPPLYKEILKSCLKEGVSFPAAQEKAFQALGTTASFSPNDILGREYVKALLKYSSSMEGETLKRETSYHDKMLSDIPSATAVRAALKSDTPLKGIPDEALDLLLKTREIRGPVFPDDLSTALYYRLLGLEDYTPYLDVSCDLDIRIRENLDHYESFSHFSSLVKTRNLTEGRVKRALLHIFLDITKEDALKAGRDAFLPPVRVLGIKKGSPVYGELSRRSCLPLIAVNKDMAILNSEQKAFFSSSLRATRFYEGLLREKYHHPCKNEFKRRFLVI